MSIPGWKNFSFFDKEAPLPAGEHDVPGNATCCASGDGELVFGCADGTAVALDAALTASLRWPVHSGRVAAAVALPGTRLLVTVGEEEVGAGAATLKLWNLARIKPSTGNPELLRGVKLFQKSQEASEVTQLAVHHQPAAGGHGGGITTAAVGLADGGVQLLRGDMSRERERLQRGRVNLGATGSTPAAVAGLELSKPGGMEELVVFAVTEKLTASVRVADVLQGPGQRVAVTASTLEDEGVASNNCCCLSPEGKLVVGRTQAVFFYELDGRGACFVFQGEKHHLRWLRHYLVVVSGPSAAASSGLAAGMSPAAGTGGAPRLQLHVPPVKHLAMEWGMLVAVLHDGSVLRFKERDLSQKLGLLLRKNMYTTALQLAEAEGAEPSILGDVQRRHGDHLYAKNDYDAAMAAYVATLGQLEPSYVIRRFLDVQRIHNLTNYLEALHHARLANADHTTLLLNCYTKLKDVHKLDAFIHENAAEEGEAPKFDTETAVRVCRAAGYYEHALYVALQADEHTWYLDVLVEDCAQYEEALAYIDGLPGLQAAEALQKYGKMLVNHKPEQTTALLMRLCTPAHDGGSAEPESVASFAHLYADRPLALMLLCEFILNSSTPAHRPASEPLLYHTLMDLYLAKELRDAAGPVEAQGQEAAAPDMPGSSESTRRDKALALLKSGWPTGEEPRYDSEHMLVLCRMHSFQPGLLFLYEQKRLYREVLGLYMTTQDHNGLIDACVRLGDASAGGDPQLWTEVLAYFAERPGTECTSQLKEVLEHIEAGSLLPPLVVLQTLAKNPELKMGMVKDYIGRQLATSNASIQTDRDSIAKYQAETAKMRAEVKELQSKARVYQASKCALSGAPLELPAVHFLCGHSFSMKSLGENDAECPLCAPQHRTVLDIRRSMRAGASEQDKFFTQLKNSADGFSVVAEFFGRGILNAVSHRAMH
eukprot:jgi/Tetstr1/461427/TSEL_006537.t2